MEKKELPDKHLTFPKKTLLKKLWVQLNYDLLQVPNYIDEDEQKTAPKEKERIERNPKRAPKKTKNPDGPYKSRNDAANPAPHSRNFSPDWIDMKSEVELALADYTPLVEEKKRMDREAIVFWARASGKLADGRPKQFPLLHEKIDLTDLRTGEISGYGYVSERYFTRKRVMGVLVLRPIYWNTESPLYS